MNAILYINKTGCQWRMLPSHFAPWQTVYYYFRTNGSWRVLLRTSWIPFILLFGRWSAGKKVRVWESLILVV